VAEVEACLASGDLDCAERALATARDDGATSADLYDVEQQLRAQQTELVRLADARATRVAAEVSAGEACLARSDFTCAEARLDAAFAEQADAPEAIALEQSIAAAKRQLAADQERVRLFLAQATECFERRDYSCTLARAESALSLLPDDPSAKAMIKRAEDAQRKLKMNIQIE
jgi:hypothetical protein